MCYSSVCVHFRTKESVFMKFDILEFYTYLLTDFNFG